MSAKMLKAWTAEELEGLTVEETLRQREELLKTIMPILGERHPGVQGEVLANLVATFIMGFQSKELRDQSLAMWLRHLTNLLAIDERELEAETKH